MPDFYVASHNATRLQGRNISPTAPTDTQALKWNAGTSLWEPSTDTSGAPTDATYVVLSLNGTLTNERVLTGTANQVVLTDGGAGSTITLSLPQSIATTSAVTFGSVTIGTAASATGTALFRGVTSGVVTLSVADIAGTWTMKLPTTAGSNTNVLQTDGSGNTSWVAVSTGAPTDATYVTLTTNGTLTNERVLTGTANQVVLTDNGAGSTIVLSLPQSIATTSSVTFGSVTLGAASSATGVALFKGTTSGTVTLSVVDAAGTWTMKLPTSAGSNTNLLQTDGSGNTSWVAAPAASTELIALAAAQVNVSSVGSTRTDTPGNTYGEAGTQTRLTTIASYIRSSAMKVSGHTNAGTATFQFWDVTNAASINTATTTSTTEVSLSAMTSTNRPVSSALTIMTKNSGAGNTITIDAGGMVAGDTAAQNPAAATAYGLPAPYVNPLGGYSTSVSLALVKAFSTATATIQMIHYATNSSVGTSTPIVSSNIGATFGTSEANTVFTRTPTLRTYSIGTTCSALSVANSYLWIWATDVRVPSA